MTIEIYATPVGGFPTEIHEWQGDIAAFMHSQGISFENEDAQPIAVFANGIEVPVERWGETYPPVEMRPVTHGVEFIYYAIAAVVAVGVSLLLAPGAGRTNETQQGANLQSADATGNVAKANQIVPELAGRFQRFPDYLVPPHRYFSDPRTQYLEMLLCVGPGYYQINASDVKIGNTPLDVLQDSEFFIYQPGASVAAHGLHKNWYPCPEVGGTSAGTAGLELSANVVESPVLTSTSYVMSGKTITGNAPWPNGWGVGTEVQLFITVPYDVSTKSFTTGENPRDISEFKGDFSHIGPLYTGMPLKVTAGSISLDLKVWTTTGSGPTQTAQFVRVIEGIEPDGPWLISEATAAGINFYRDDIGYLITGIGVYDATFQAVIRNTGSYLTGWVGFPSRAIVGSRLRATVLNTVIYGDWAGPFIACPVGESATTHEFDVFFPQGLCVLDSADLKPRTVTVEIQYRPFGDLAWISYRRNYTEATLDQIGFTEILQTNASVRLEVRARRIGALSTSTTVKDTVQWYGLRTLLTTPTSYPGWTTIGVRIKGLGNISASSENRLNLIATRMLPTLLANGNWTATRSATRDISAFMNYISTSLGVTGIAWDTAELLRLDAIWKARGETADHVFDLTTVRGALAVCLQAGMSDLTLSEGLLTPVRDGVRTPGEWEQSYSAQNTTTDIVRAFTTRTHDDNDGVQVEYIDADDGYIAKTVNCIPPGSLGLKLQKIKVQGVVSKTRAWRIGMRRAWEIIYSRWSYLFTTELDALNSNYGSYIALVPDIPDYGQSMLALSASRSGGNVTIGVSEKLPVPNGPASVAWRDTQGKLVGPFVAIRLDDYRVTATGVGSEYSLPNTSLKLEPAHVYFGSTTSWVMPAIVKKISPAANNTVNVQAVNYDARVYQDDDNSPI